MFLKDFIKERKSSGWIQHPEFEKFYASIRRVELIHPIETKLIFQIKEIKAKRPGRGSFRALIDEICSLWDGEINIKDVENSYFKEYLEKNGWERAEFGTNYVCSYRLIREDK